MSTITNLQSSDDGADSLGIINANFANLNTDKVEGAGGSDTQIQFNDGGDFGGDARLTFNKTTGAFQTEYIQGTIANGFYIENSVNSETFLQATNNSFIIESNGTELKLENGAGFLACGDALVQVDTTTVAFSSNGGNKYNFQGNSVQSGILDFSNIATSNKTFTFPNKSGVVSLVENTNTINIPTERTPASATATGTKGDICWDADYIYVCTATNTWKRTAISTW